jgi:hypothetical protein
MRNCEQADGDGDGVGVESEGTAGRQQARLKLERPGEPKPSLTRLQGLDVGGPCPMAGGIAP